MQSHQRKDTIPTAWDFDNVLLDELSELRPVSHTKTPRCVILLELNAGDTHGFMRT